MSTNHKLEGKKYVVVLKYCLHNLRAIILYVYISKGETVCSPRIEPGLEFNSLHFCFHLMKSL